jgi:hypothetical protein
MPPIPTKKIPQLTAYGSVLQGPEMLEIWAVNTSRRVTARDFVLPSDSLITLTGMGGSLPGSRQLVSSATIEVVDNGAGNTVQLEALGTGALPGSPTALVGLAAIPGVAVTWMRSDAAPALDQGINPIWTGDHEFAGRVGTTGVEPEWRWSETDAAADNRVWTARVSSERFSIGALNDLATVYGPWVEVDRTDAVIDLVNLLGTEIQVQGQNVRDAAILTSGTVDTARLGSGVADATTWLRGDQSWQVLPGSFTGFANPTALVGIAAVDGAATTAMRSDAAPAIDQGIIPIWTATHTFSSPSAAVLLSSASPQLDWNEGDAAANNRRWRWGVQGEQLSGQLVNDANNATANWVAVDRTLNVVDSIALTSTALTWNGNPLLSTGTAFANPTGTIGLAAVNGVATTAMRSDAAPALSQAIVPTWTGQHTFTLSGTTATPTIRMVASRVDMEFQETDAPADNRRWFLRAQDEQFSCYATNDASSVNTIWLQVDRTGTTIDDVTFPALTSFTLVGSSANPSVRIFSTRPHLEFRESDASANNGRWAIDVQSEQLVFETVSDAGAGTTFLTVDRTGTNPDFIVASCSQGFISTLANSANFPFTARNTSAAGDSGFVLFQTEPAPVTRGAIVYNRGAGLVSYNTTSDARRKKNIVDAPEASDILDSIRVRSFDWIDSGVHLDHWLVAQELHGVFPFAVTVGGENRDWAVDPAKLVPLLVKELQSVRRRLADVESSIH